jgi:hypothetical protein
MSRSDIPSYLQLVTSRVPLDVEFARKFIEYSRNQRDITRLQELAVDYYETVIEPLNLLYCNVAERDNDSFILIDYEMKRIYKILTELY